MSRTRARRILFVAGLLLVPVPLFGLADAFVPTTRLAELALVVAVTIAAEGAGGVAALLFGLFAVHVLVWALALWCAAWLLSWTLARLGPLALGRITVAAVLIGVIGASLFRIYDTPFHATLPHATLLELYP